MAGSNIQHDRAKFPVLVIAQKSLVNNQLRQSLKSLGFTQISSATSHVQGLERVRTRNFTHYLFDAKDTDMQAIEFVRQIMELDKEAIMIAVSEEPKIDDVFSLLKTGARSFLVPPLSVDSIEQILVQASDGTRLSDAVLNAPDRNAAFVAVILNNLYRLSVAMRQSREFATAQRDVRIYSYSLRESMEMAQLFCEGPEENLREKIIEGCINRARDASTRLGRLRKKLRKTRVDEEDEPAEAGS